MGRALSTVEDIVEGTVNSLEMHKGKGEGQADENASGESWELYYRGFDYPK